jgi:hypothetical protein
VNGGRGSDITVVLHDVPIPACALEAPFLDVRDNTTNNSPTHNPQPGPQRPTFLHRHVAQFLPMHSCGQQHVPARNGRMVEEGEDMAGGEEEVGFRWRG